MSDRRRGSARPGAFAREPEPPRAGPVPVTATGVLILIALIGSLVYLAYALLLVRDASQIPLLVSGAVVLGIVFVFTAAVGVRAAWKSSLRGRDGRAFAHAIVGGLASLAAAVCFAGAFILAAVSRS